MCVCMSIAMTVCMRHTASDMPMFVKMLTGKIITLVVKPSHTTIYYLHGAFSGLRSNHCQLSAYAMPALGTIVV